MLLNWKIVTYHLIDDMVKQISEHQFIQNVNTNATIEPFPILFYSAGKWYANIVLLFSSSHCQPDFLLLTVWFYDWLFSVYFLWSFWKNCNYHHCLCIKRSWMYAKSSIHSCIFFFRLFILLWVENVPINLKIYNYI